MKGRLHPYFQLSPWNKQDSPEDLRGFVVDQDVAFQEAMIAAIEAGTEKANPLPNGTYGIDRRPCTRDPVFVPHANRSYAAPARIGTR